MAQELNIPRAEARIKVRGNLTFAAMAAKIPGQSQKAAPDTARQTKKANSTLKAEGSKTSPTSQTKEDYYRGIEKELKEVKKMLRLLIDGIMESIPRKKIEKLRESAAELLKPGEEPSETEFSDPTILSP
jgi:hypothetical protein